LTKEKKMLMKNSMFYKLTQVENSKESSSILIASLCQLYDPIQRRFVFNNKTTFQFCTKEVANVLGIKDIVLYPFSLLARIPHPSFLLPSN
jgi:hypothetical protein